MQATFFAIGAEAQRTPALARRIVEAGHALGNHTLQSQHPWLLTRRRGAQRSTGRRNGGERCGRSGDAMVSSAARPAPRLHDG